jgi:hypothetical protein
MSRGNWCYDQAALDEREKRLQKLRDRMNATEMDAQAPYEPFYDPNRFNPADLERSRVAELLPFLTAFAAGQDVWAWEMPRLGREGRWAKMEVFDMLLRVEALSLTWREDGPEMAVDSDGEGM